jgi:hypothetical protein
MFNIKRKIYKITSKNENGKYISRQRVRDFLKENMNKTIWFKGEPFHINDITGRYDSPLSCINPHDIYYHNALWGDIFIVYRHILININTSGSFSIHYSQTCNWNVSDNTVSSNDSKQVLYVTMYGDVMTEYVSGKYDNDVYNLLKFFVNNDAFYCK